MEELKEKRLFSMLRYYKQDSPDIFNKCAVFDQSHEFINREYGGILNGSHRVLLENGLDNKVLVRDGDTGLAREVLCFDSNGYLGFQHHPAVKEAMIQAIRDVGTGTPSVPLLGGTNAHVKTLEEKIARFHDREDAMIFSSAYAANTSLTPALIRGTDIVLYDQAVHASTLEGINQTKCKATIAFKSNDAADLEEKLKQIDRTTFQGGILVLAEGVYSMQGTSLDLVKIKSVCASHGAKLVVDECHSVGVLGPRGRGIEDELQMPGACDLIVGCFSKAFGFSGGYVTGPRQVIHYLRYFAHSYVFSTSIPAAQCAGMAKALEILDDEPFWLQRLRENSRLLRRKMRAIGLEADDGPSSIVKVSIHDNKTLFRVGKDLLSRGLKCGVVTFPAVKDHRGLLRLVVTARHTTEDIARAAEILRASLSDFGLLKKEDARGRLNESAGKSADGPGFSP